MVEKRVEREDAVIRNDLLPFIQHHDLSSLRKRELLHKVSVVYSYCISVSVLPAAS